MEDLVALAMKHGGTVQDVADIAKKYGGTVQESLEADTTLSAGDYLGKLVEPITGSERSTPTTESLQDWASMPEMNSMSMASFKSALGTMMTDPEETVQVLKANFPGINVGQDEKGNYIIKSSIDGKPYAIKPGFQVSDIPRAGAGIAAFTPAGKATSILGSGAAMAGTQAAVEASQAATGGEFNAEDVAMAGALGSGTQAAARGIGAIRGKLTGAAAKVPAEVAKAGETIAAGEGAGVKVMTSDVLPPKTFASKWLQTTGERIPVAGTGGVRQAQQTQRADAVTNLLREYGAGDAELVTKEVMRDLTKKRGAELTKYSDIKKGIVDKIGRTGQVPMDKTMKSIDDQIAKLESLRTKEVSPIVERLGDWKEAIKGQNLENIELLRKQIGESFKAPELAGVKSTGEKALNSIYGAVREDINSFIKNVGDNRDVTKWMVANKRLSALVGELDMGALKSALKKGDATPEVINRLLFSQKPSEIRQLYKGLTNDGKANARAAILSRAAEKAGGLDAISPDKFANEVKRLGKSVGVFFNGKEAQQLDGLMRVLNETKRAGAASAAPPTGVQVALPVGAAFLADFMGSGGAATAAGISAGAFARAYESAPVRNLLLQLAKVKAGSAKESELIGKVLPYFQSAKQFEEEKK
jgi:hypothetical protein